jgi:hypothetical protein
MGCHVEAYGDLVEPVTYGKEQGCRSESEICESHVQRPIGKEGKNKETTPDSVLPKGFAQPGKASDNLELLSR